MRSRLLVAAAIIIAALTAQYAHAANAVAFSLTSVGAGNVPSFTWSAPWASTCAASGNWGGARATSGSATGNAITGTSTYTLTCTAAADTAAHLTWTAPTTNTDGSALTDLAGFNVYSGLSSSAMALLAKVPGATVTSYQASMSQPAGTVVYFYVTAYNSAGVESPKSATVSKTFSGAASTASTSITVTVPSAPAVTVN